MNIEKAKKIDGWMNDIDLFWLAEQASHSYSILELGSYMGRSTRAICDNTQGSVTSVDLWTQEDNKLEADFSIVFQEFAKNLLDHLMSYKLYYMQMHTTTALDILRREGRTFDFIFIDASHEYEDVKRDILSSWKLLLPGGILSGHDYEGTWTGVKKAVDEIFPNVTITNGIWHVRKDLG